MSPTEERWSIPLRTGSLSQTLLTLLKDRPHPEPYLVQAAKTEGIYVTEAGVLEVLGRLEREGQVKSAWEKGANGRPTRVYTATERGLARLASLRGKVDGRQADY